MESAGRYSAMAIAGAAPPGTGTLNGDLEAAHARGAKVGAGRIVTAR